MPHNEPPDTVRFNNAGRPVRVNSGQQYPGCNAQQLNEQSRAVELSGQVFGHQTFHAISLDKAAADLIAFLKVPSNTRQQLIIDDLLDAFGCTNWQPDIVIKAFGDLDKIYFNGALRRRVQIEWCCDPSRFVSRSSLFPYAYGMTFLEEYTVVPTARIVLNARVLFKAPFYESRRRKVWGTVLHEMIHAYLCVRCSTAADESEEARGADPTHSTLFQNIANLLSSRTQVELGFDISWQKELLEGDMMSSDNESNYA